MYEITENNFISGLEHAFTKEELEIWNQKCRNIEAGTGTVSEDEIKYMIYLYDAHGKQVCSYLMDKGDNILQTRSKNCLKMDIYHYDKERKCEKAYDFWNRDKKFIVYL